MLFALILPFLAALLFIFPLGKYKDHIYRGIVILPFSLFIFYLLYPVTSGGSSGLPLYGNMEFLSFNMATNFDGLGRLFALIITGIGTLIFLYAGGYMKDHKYKMRLLGFLLLFMGAMLGIVITDNLIAIFLFWELTSISSFFLIGFNNEEEASRKSALKALLVTGGGGLVMLAGFIMLGEIAGSYNLTEIFLEDNGLYDHPYFISILILIFIGAFTKSAQFPFHFWLPGAMKAPTPVSAYLHSATMVKAGVYLLARMHPILGDHPVWVYTLMIVGGVTMVYAAIHAVLRTDLKAILAYSTVSALGIMVFLIGVGTSKAILAVSVFILIHALYKAALFMITGILDLGTKTRDITKLQGLRWVMWPVALAGLLAAISNAGIPPSFGFIGKDLIYEGTMAQTDLAVLLTGLAIGTNILLLIAGFMAGWKPFSGKIPSSFKNVQMPEWTMWTPPLLLSFLGIFFGLFPQLIEKFIAHPVYKSIAGIATEVHLSLWHGFNVVLYLSIATIVIGVVVYIFYKPGKAIQNRLIKLEFLSPENIWTKIFIGFEKFSIFWTRTLQNGFLRYYLLTILGFFIVIMGIKLFANGQYYMIPATLTEITIYEVITLIILLAAMVVTVISRSRLAAVAAMGVVGYAICIIFVFYSAPDLAMTQFTIDTLTVILFVLVLYKLPRFIPITFTAYHIRDLFVSLSIGGIITLLALEVLQSSPSKNISEFYAQNAYLMAKGKNIVNVILVDFRGADTLIEIVVLSIAAIGVFSLLKLHIRPDQKAE